MMEVTFNKNATITTAADRPLHALRTARLDTKEKKFLLYFGEKLSSISDRK
jgi:hypothetical protein